MTEDEQLGGLCYTLPALSITVDQPLGMVERSLLNSRRAPLLRPGQAGGR